MDRRRADICAYFQDTLEAKRAHQIVQSPPITGIYATGIHIHNQDHLIDLFGENEPFFV